VANLFDGVKKITTPRGEVKKITRKSDGVVLFKSGYTNLVPLSTEADGKTIYNGGLGYKNGCRIRSGGAETASSGASCTGFIPVKPNDVVRLSGYAVDTPSTVNNAINVSDENYNNLGQLASNAPNGYGIIQKTWSEYNWSRAKGVKEEKTGVWTWTVPPDASIAYIRITGDTSNNGSKMIVTVNEEIA
jgi:hypothetical protein